MSDTPETDAQLTTFTSISKLKKHFVNRTGTVSAEFARKLERERDQWKADCLEQCQLLAQSADREEKMIAKTYRCENEQKWRAIADQLAQALGHSWFGAKVDQRGKLLDFLEKKKAALAAYEEATK